MNIYANPSESELKELLKRPVFERTGLETKVQAILDDVKERGDEALKEYASKFDGVDLHQLLVTEAEFEEALSLVDQELKDAIAVAIKVSPSFTSPFKISSANGSSKYF